MRQHHLQDEDESSPLLLPQLAIKQRKKKQDLVKNAENLLISRFFFKLAQTIFRDIVQDVLNSLVTSYHDSMSVFSLLYAMET